MIMSRSSGRRDPVQATNSFASLVVDDDDDDDEDTEEEDNHESKKTTLTAANSIVSIARANNSNSNSNSNSNNNNNGNSGGVASSAANNDNHNTDAKRKRRKRKSKKKSKKGAAAAAAGGGRRRSRTVSGSSFASGISSVDDSERKLRFGDVVVREFNRCLGGDVVPADGGWPLGLSPPKQQQQQHHHDVNNNNNDDDDDDNPVVSQIVSVDAFERAKQERLRRRYKNLPESALEDLLPPSKKKDSSSLSLYDEEELETRQWDYRSGRKNPLFRLLKEQERMKILLGHTDNGSGTSSTSSSSSSSSSNSSRQNHHHHHRDAPSERKVPHTRSSSSRFVEMYNDTFTQVEVHHVRNELERIRNSRSMEGAAGCTCRKLHVYLMPESGGGKKAHHRRMNVNKVREELRKRHMLPSQSTSRENLEKLLHDAVEQEPCCQFAEDCPCIRNGIGCQADSCTCWLASHQQKNKHHGGGSGSSKNGASLSHDSVSVDEIQRRCGNRHGMYAVDLAGIDAYRQNFYCQEVTM